MFHSAVITAVLSFCALSIVPSMSMAAISPPPPVLQDQSLEAAVEGGIRRLVILEANRGRAAWEAADGRDCFYTDNKSDADCRETQIGNH